MINRQARSITGMYSSTPIHPLLCEAGLIPASILLDYRQRVYAHRLLSFPDLHPAKEILPINLREGDKGFRPEELPENTLMWTQNVRTRLYGQWLAWQITIDHSIDPAEGVEPVTKLTFHSSLKPDIIVKGKREAIEEAKKDKAGLVLWTDGSKLDQGHAAAAVCWEDKPAGEWKEKSIFLGKNKEILDAELCNLGGFRHCEKDSQRQKHAGNHFMRLPKSTWSNCAPIYLSERPVFNMPCVSEDGRTSAQWAFHHLSIDPRPFRSHRKRESQSIC